MAAERSGLENRPEYGAGEPSPDELQRQLEQTRESISNTVTEIQDTMTHEYENVKDEISETLDWRLQIERHPFAFTIGAMAIGMLLGRGIAQSLGGSSEPYDYSDTMSHPVEREEGESLTSRMRERTGGMMNSIANSNAVHQLQDGMSTVVNELVSELVRVGRETVIPTVVAKVSHSLGVDEQRSRERP